MTITFLSRLLQARGARLRHADRAVLVPRPALDALRLDVAVLEVADPRVHGVRGVHVDRVEVRHEPEAHRAGLRREGLRRLARLERRVALVVRQRAPVRVVEEDAPRRDPRGEGVEDLRLAGAPRDGEADPRIHSRRSRSRAARPCAAHSQSNTSPGRWPCLVAPGSVAYCSTWRIIEKIIDKERPEALLPTMGGRTALTPLSTWRARACWRSTA